jgi:hypothetical protein
MKYLIEMDYNANKPQTVRFEDSGAARAYFADCRYIRSVFTASLVSISETGQRVTLDRITH